MTDNNATIKMFTIANASCKQKQNIKIFIYSPITHVRKWRIIKAQEESHQILFFFFGIEKEKKKKVSYKIIISPIFLEQKMTGEKGWEIRLDKAAEATP